MSSSKGANERAAPTTNSVGKLDHVYHAGDHTDTLKTIANVKAKMPAAKLGIGFHCGSRVGELARGQATLMPCSATFLKDRFEASVPTEVYR